MAKQDTILQTRDYDHFTMLRANRDVTKGHVERLQQAFEENGNLTRVQPILVNEKMHIIDGQHRFEVCKEMGEPIYYTIVPGLTVKDARNMNILHRGWGPEDYAKSYAESGDQNYITYRQLKEDYGVSHKLLILAINGGDKSKNMYKEFREGNMVITDLPKVKEILDVFASVKEVTGVNNAPFYMALFKAIKSQGYDHYRMLKKLAQHGEQLYKPYSNVEDNLRLLEEIYNYSQSEGNRIRLY